MCFLLARASAKMCSPFQNRVVFQPTQLLAVSRLGFVWVRRRLGWAVGMKVPQLRSMVAKHAETIQRIAQRVLVGCVWCERCWFLVDIISGVLTCLIFIKLDGNSQKFQAQSDAVRATWAACDLAQAKVAICFAFTRLRGESKHVWLVNSCFASVVSCCFLPGLIWFVDMGRGCNKTFGVGEGSQWWYLSNSWMLLYLSNSWMIL